jgi:recombination protein RecR
MQHKARITMLKKTTEKTGVLNEIIIALSPTTIGDLNASLLAGELKGLSQKITRLARGIPTGGEIEFADEQTLIDSLKNRS